MEDCIISKLNGYLNYNRYFHTYQKKVCEKLEKRYTLTDVKPTAALFPSGMNAIDSIFQVLSIQNKWESMNIVYGSELYCDTPRTIKYLSENYIHCQLSKLNVNGSEDEILKLFKRSNQLTILFLESCSNPNGHIFDFQLLKKIKNILGSDKLKVIVDNTWVTSSLFNPFQFDEVDIVVNSLTKYYGGDVSGICGVILSRNEKLGERVTHYGKVKGLHVCPRYCELLNENIDKMDDHIKKTSIMTLDLAKHVSNFTHVNYPKLENHDSYKLANEYYGKLGPSVFTFCVPLNKADALKWMRSSKVFQCSTSFGASDSRFDQWPSSKKKGKNYETYCRFSVGYKDNYEDVKEELSQMLKKIKWD